MPRSPILEEKYQANGILIAQRESSVMNMGIRVSPAPRSTPLNLNMMVIIR